MPYLPPLLIAVLSCTPQSGTGPTARPADSVVEPLDYGCLSLSGAGSKDRSRFPEMARLFALLTMAMADTVATTYQTKFVFQAWRPATAIREADTDNNPNTTCVEHDLKRCLQPHSLSENTLRTNRGVSRAFSS
jgi:hypothetical protein